jgi:hypothetical protein
MAPKKTLRNLSKKGLKKAGSVKGGRKKQPTDAGKLAANHNQIIL